MNEQTTFAAQVAANEKAQAHAQEIQQTRVGGLGGSDANILLKIGRDGLAALSATDHKRLCIMLGVTEQQDWGGNAHTQAGHAFEDYAEKTLPWGGFGYEREKVIEQKLANNFKTFAHADFVTGGKRTDVVECKFVQATTQATASKYAAQLQWYYLLGAKSVRLFHGTGTADPFEVFEANIVTIERDEETINYLLHGIKTLDDAISDGWKPETVEKVSLTDTPEIVQQAFVTVAEISAKIKALEEQKTAAAEILKEYIEGFGLSGIVAGDGSKHQVIYNKAGVTRTLDTGKLQADHPNIDLGKYYKVTNKKSSITYK